MSSGNASLSRDPDILIEMIAGLRAENEKLRAMLETLKRALYGVRLEKRDIEESQLALGLGDLSALPVEPEPNAAVGGEPDRPKPAPPKASPNIGVLSNYLPREDVVIEPETDICPGCQGKLHRIGEDVSEMLDIVPAIIRVKRAGRNMAAAPVRPRWCRRPRRRVPAGWPPWRGISPLRGLIDGGLPTAALLAHFAVSKFAWHLPLHRQTQMLAGQGIHLDRSTLVHWLRPGAEGSRCEASAGEKGRRDLRAALERAAWWLKPLHDLLLATVMTANKIFCDDTPLPVLDRTRKRTGIGRLWC
jgi:transposase